MVSKERIDLAQHAPLEKPLAIYIEPTNICNFSRQCFFCAQHREDYREQAGYFQHIPMEIVEKTVSDIRAMGGVKSIKLHFLGEGSLHPRIGEIARLACSVSNDVMLTTNGSCLDLEKSMDLLDAGLHFIRVSIYAETKAAMQGKVLQNIRLLKSIRDACGQDHPRILIKWLSNDPEFAAWVRDAYKTIADDFLFEGLRNFASAYVQIEPTPLSIRTGPQIACPLPFYQLIVKANGDVAPCCAAWDQTLNIGNIMQENLLDLWHSEKLARIHRIHLEGRRKELSTCSTCDTIFQNGDSIDNLSVAEYDRRRSCA